MSIRVKSGRERRTERERVEKIWTIGVYKTFVEVLVIGILTGVAFIALLLGVIYGW